MVKLTHRILQFLIEHKENEYSIRELSKILKVDYKNTYDAVQKIPINKNKKGNATYLSFKPVLTTDIYEVEKQRQETIAKKLPLLYKDIQELENPFVIIVLFGSYAKGEETKHSDIDLCIIYESETAKSRLGIHPDVEEHSFYHEEFLQMIQSTQFTVGRQILKEGIVLKNIELYYELIRRSQKEL